LVAVQAYAELEPDTPGTIQGLTYALGGKKIVLADPSGLVTAVRYRTIPWSSLAKYKYSNEGFFMSMDFPRIGCACAEGLLFVNFSFEHCCIS